MAGSIRDFLRVGLVLPVLCAACATGVAPATETTTSSSSGGGGSGGSGNGPCDVDCSKIETPQCMMAVCNTGQELGPLNTCVVVTSPHGTPCDDGVFCTVGDICDSGTCGGGTQNNCGITPAPCSAVICYEESKSCDTTPVNDGTECTPTDLCRVNGVCQIGECVGEPKDCSFSPLTECNTVACDPTTGKCKGTADPAKDNAPCVLTGDLCTVNRTCLAGQCGGGAPKDCSALDVGCEVGLCDPESGLCGPTAAPVGTTCSDGIAECHVGACDVKGTCLSLSAPNGVACNDHNSCSKTDKCTAGACAGAAVAGCLLYLNEDFEDCSNGWTLGGDWQCGTPSDVGPPAAHLGAGVLATRLDSVYSVGQSFDTTTADSPPVNLTAATKPTLSFWAWDHTEGNTFDGWNLKVSTDGGQTFTPVTTVVPAYTLTIAGQPAWGGDHSTDGWRNYVADLSAYTGQTIILRFAFRSDGATVFPGVYLDDIVVAEPLQIPIFITTSPPLPDVYAGMSYSAQVAKLGGTSGAVWSIKPGGVNTAWLTIDPTTGVLKGVPSTAELGPVSVTVRVEEPALPTNFDEQTYTFTVKGAAYYTSFENSCPDGWTLTGDWECGVPTVVGPATAYAGTQCLATQIAGNYHDLLAWDANTATSPDIDLTAVPNPILTFRMWLFTEGATYDGANLQISTDGGMTYSVLTTVMPAYPLNIAGKPAWGGYLSAAGWQLVQADLSAYTGQTIRLRFAFRSDSSGNFPGVYIDDLFVD